MRIFSLVLMMLSMNSDCLASIDTPVSWNRIKLELDTEVYRTLEIVLTNKKLDSFKVITNELTILIPSQELEGDIYPLLETLRISTGYGLENCEGSLLVKMQFKQQYLVAKKSEIVFFFCPNRYYSRLINIEPFEGQKIFRYKKSGKEEMVK